MKKLLLILLIPFFALAATCRDGSHSNATGRGACSHHGGVSSWDDEQSSTQTKPTTTKKAKSKKVKQIKAEQSTTETKATTTTPAAQDNSFSVGKLPDVNNY